MISVLSVPAAVVRLQRVMCPENTGVLTTNDNILAGVTKRPHLRRVDALHSPLGGLRVIGQGDSGWRLSYTLGGTVRFDVGHIALGCALSYLDFRFATLGWRSGRGALAAWHAGFEARPSARATEVVDA